MKNIYRINNNIYITNSAKIKVGDWCFELYNGDSKAKAPKFEDSNGNTWWLRKMNMNCSPNSIGVKKIILTTDEELIKDGVQSIAPEFIEWFAQNKDCEEIETKLIYNDCRGECGICDYTCVPVYVIIMPKQETIEKTQYPIGGFAPGNYSCNCVTCKKVFQGDKRAVQCEPCAIEMINIKTSINDKDGIEIIKTTLEKAAEEYADKQSSKGMRNDPLKFTKSGEELWLEAKTDFTEGAKWQAAQIYNQIDLTKLCYYDRRNPDFQFDADEEEIARGEFAKEDCYCDNCFYGRAKMTEYFISLTKKI